MKKINNFSLAEILITIGIIGIVSAITIPNLVSNYRKHQIEVQLKENYSIIQQAVRYTINDDISYTALPDFSTAAIKNWYHASLGKYIKSVTECYNTAGVNSRSNRNTKLCEFFIWC